MINLDAKYKAMQAGYEARMHGLPIVANPHVRGDMRRRAWSQGWQEADRVILNARRGGKPNG